MTTKAPDKAPPVHSVVEHHPDCPEDLPHGVLDGDGHLLACKATPAEAQDIALHLDISDASPAPDGGGVADSPAVTAAAGDVPDLARWEDIELVAVGEWALSTGPASFTTSDLQSAVGAADCPAVGRPVLKLGHNDPRFDGEPAIGWVAGMRLNDSKTKIVGDFAGMPGWLGEILPSAYPDRSVEGSWNFVCQMGHTHPFVLTAVALLGVTPPGVGIIASLADIGALYGVEAARPADPAALRPFTLTQQGGLTMPLAGSTIAAAGTNTTIDDVRREFYDSAPWTQWIIELQLDPLVLIVSDDSTGDLYRVPVMIDAKSPGAVTFGQQETVLVQYISAPTSKAEAAKGGPARRIAAAWASAAQSRAGVAASWTAATQVKNLGDDPTAAQLKAMYALPADTKSDSKLPHHDVGDDGTVGEADPDGCSAAIGAINGAMGGLVGVSDADKKAAYAHLAAHLKAAGQEAPELKAAAEGKAGGQAADPPDGSVTCPTCDGSGTINEGNKECPDCDGNGWVTGDAGDSSTSAAAAGHRLDRLRAIRAAAGDGGDADGNVKSLVASLDATLDEASQLTGGIDRAGLAEPVGQALDLITAAEAIADQLMDMLGIYDPDDPAPVAAGAAHGPTEGEHEHPHSAFGQQGSDQTHNHLHAHQNDAVHKHVHGAMSAAPAPTGGNPDVEFTNEQLAAIRGKLGIKDGEEITPAAIAAAFTAPKIEASAAAGDGGEEGGGSGLPPIDEGSYLVDSAILKEWQARAAAGDAAVRRLHVDERDKILAEAVQIGKFPQAKLEAYRDRWNRDPEGTRELVGALAAGLVPVGTGPVGHPGFDGDLGLDFEQQDAYRKLYPEDAQGKGGVSAAPGVRGGR